MTRTLAEPRNPAVASPRRARPVRGSLPMAGAVAATLATLAVALARPPVDAPEGGDDRGVRAKASARADDPPKPLGRPAGASSTVASAAAKQGQGTSTANPPADAKARERRIDESIRRAGASTVALEYETGRPGVKPRVASGVVINDQGDVLSVRIEPPTDQSRPSIVACDAWERRHPTRWVAADPDTGLTLLRVQSNDLPPTRLAAQEPGLGAEVFVIGNAYGLGPSVVRGNVAGFNRQLAIGSVTLTGLIQVQTRLHPGDSGALLADVDGGWLGLVRGRLAEPEAAGAPRAADSDFGFAIPAREALWVADRLRALGKVDRAYLGLRFAANPPRLAPAAEADRGAKVVEVVGDSPAARAGLKPGDRVVKVDDRPVDLSHDLTDRLDRTAAGSEMILEILREAIRSRVVVRSASRPEPTPAAAPTTAPAIAPPTGPAPAPAPTPEVVRELLDRIEALEKRVKDLEADQGSTGKRPE